MHRRPSMSLLSAPLLFWAALASAEVTGSPAPNQLYGHITSNRTLTFASPGPNYEIIGDLTIDPGVTLTVERGVLLTPTPYSDFLASGTDRGRVELNVFGTLLISAGPGASRIGFGTPATWVGVNVASGGVLSLSNSELLGAVVGARIATGGTANLSQVLIYAVRQGLEISTGATARLAGTSLVGPGIGQGTVGIVAYAPIFNADSLSPSPNRVEGFHIGVQVVAPNVTVVRTISSHCGYGFVSDADASVFSYCTAYESEYAGIRTQNHFTRLYNSIVSGGTPIENTPQSSSMYCNYTVAWGANGAFDPFAGSATGAQCASYDPFLNPPLTLHPASFFTNYSVSGGQIGAYGPGPVGPTPILAASVVDAVGSGGFARIRWFSESRGSSKAGIFRRTEDGDWQPLTVLYPDGQGYVTLEDRDVEPGARYGYGVGVQRDSRVGIEGEVWVTVEAPISGLSLTAIEPNPATTSWGVAFMSPEAADSRVEVVDLGGRLVRSVGLGSLGVGRQTVSVSAQGLSPGVYWIRVTQGGRSALAKAVKTN